MKAATDCDAHQALPRLNIQVVSSLLSQIAGRYMCTRLLLRIFDRICAAFRSCAVSYDAACEAITEIASST